MWLVSLFEPLVRTNLLYEKQTVIFWTHTAHERMRLARSTREDYAYGTSCLNHTRSFGI